MHPQLATLLDLQSKDLIVLEADLRLAALQSEQEALEQTLQRAESDVEHAKRSLSDGITAREALEIKIESYRAIQERRRSRIEQVRGAREAQALMTEMDLARSVMAKEESDWFRSAEVVTQLETKLQEAEARVQALGEEQREARATLETRRQAAGVERALAASARDACAQEVEKTLRARYDRLRNNRRGSVVVSLQGVACGACYTQVPMSRRNQILMGALIDGCEACGVLLYAGDANG